MAIGNVGATIGNDTLKKYCIYKSNNSGALKCLLPPFGQYYFSSLEAQEGLNQRAFDRRIVMISNDINNLYYIKIKKNIIPTINNKPTGILTATLTLGAGFIKTQANRIDFSYTLTIGSGS